MPNIDELFGDAIKKLMGVADTSDSTQNLMNVLRVAQNAGVGKSVPAGTSDEAAMIAHLKGLDGTALRALGIDPLKLQLDISNAVGGVIPHPGPYEIDSGWVESLINYYRFLDERVTFPTHPANSGVQDLVAPDAKGEIRIAIVGDWGVAPSYPVAKKVVQSMATHNPQYAIHLGDVYYSGLSIEEQSNFINSGIWPFNLPNTISLALNSNHEMYSGGVGYYNGLLQDSRFGSQSGIGYFALQNQYWLIVGLDTAYFARWSSRLYQEGTLGNQRDSNGMVQRDWFHQLVHDPAQAGKRVIVLTHHDGFDIDPGSGALAVKTLWTEMTGCVRGSISPTQSGELTGVRDWWWYWGHVHAPIVYERIFFSDNSSVTPRCAGHGAIPYLPFPVGYANYGDGTITIKWAETAKENPPPGDRTDKDRAPNGYALLTLTGTTIKEEFYDEDGRIRWSNY